MKIKIPKFFSDIFRKESKVSRVLLAPGSQGAVWSDDDYATIAKESYLKNTIAFACISEIAKGISSTPWKLFRRLANDKREPIEQHYLNDLLKHPNPDDSFNFIMFKLTAFLVMNGNAYLERVSPKEGRNKGLAQELYVHRPDRIILNINSKTGQLDYYEYEVDGRKIEWEVNPITHASDILHFKLFHPLDDWYGNSPTMSIAREIDSLNEAVEWNMKMLQNEGRPGMVVTLIGQMTEQQFEEFERKLNEKFAGSMNAGKHLLLTGEKGTEAKPYGWNPHELDNLEGGRELARKIAIGYGVPPILLQIPGDSTFCVSKNQRIATKYNWLNISDIKEGDEVWSFSEKGLELKKVLKSGQTGVKKVYRVKTKNRTIDATDNHPFMVRRTIKDNYTHEYKLEYVSLADLKVGDILVILENLPENTNDMSPIGKVTERHMELYGFYFGDGYLRDPVYLSKGKRYRRGGSIAFAIPKGVSYEQYYSDLASEILEANPCRHQRAIVFPCTSKVKEFKELGFNGLAKTKRIPKWVYGLKRDLKLAFLRGIVDSDGSIDKRGYITIGLCNKELVKDIRDLCISCGILTSNVRYSHKVVKLPNGEPFDSHSWWVNISRISDCKEIGTHTLEYQQKLDNVKEVKRPERKHLLTTGGDYSEEQVKKLVPYDYCRYQKIVSIEELDEQPVYDIEVEGNHNFFAEGICVHNSNQKEARQAFWETTIFFYLQYIRNELNNWFFPKDSKDKDLFLDYILDDIPALAPKRDLIWQRAMKSDFLTVNEKREMIGMPSIGKEGDVILVSSANIKLEDVGLNYEQIDNNNKVDDEEAEKSLIGLGYSKEEAEELIGK